MRAQTIGESARRRLAELAELLALEADEVRARERERREGKSRSELELAGLRLARAVVVDQGVTAGGRVRVTLGEDPNRRGHLARFSARPGDRVRVPDGSTGVVARRGRDRLTIVFDEAPEEDALDLELAPDAETERRLVGAIELARAAGGRFAELVELLLGDRPVGAPAPRTLAGEDLNEDQRRAAEKALGAPDVALVHGPFGTGKTSTLAAIARVIAREEGVVLALAASNAAADHLGATLLARAPELDLVRVGHPARVDERLEAHTLDRRVADALASGLAGKAAAEARVVFRRADRARDRRERGELRAEGRRLLREARAYEGDARADVFRTARVIVGTLTSTPFELPPGLLAAALVVDEASQAVTPAILLALARARRLVLGGDHRQLPPTVISPVAARGLSRTLFEALIEREGSEVYAHMLTVQHRMSARLMAFPSATFYGGRLSAHPAVAELGLDRAIEGLGDGPLEVIDVAGAGMEERADPETASKSNPEQAAVVARIVRALVAAGVAPDAIGVVTPYSAEVLELTLRLAELVDAGLEIDSVDAFQGREKDVIVFDAVRSNPAGEIGFLADLRRLNVALTRAKRRLIVVADSVTLGREPTWGALFDHAMATGAYRSVFELPG